MTSSDSNIYFAESVEQHEKKMMLKYRTERLGGRRSILQYTEENFKISDCNKEAFEFCKNFNAKKDNLYLFGSAGTGKSHLAVIAARKFDSASLVKPTDIFRSIRSCEKAYQEIESIKRYAAESVLVIDDLGVGKDTEFAVTTIYEIIDRRYSAMSGGLIVTSNLSLNQLAVKLSDDRISSRLAQMCKVFKMTGNDHRLGNRP